MFILLYSLFLPHPFSLKKIADVVFSRADSNLTKPLMGYEFSNSKTIHVPPAIAVRPVYAKLGSVNDDEVVGYLVAVIKWDEYLQSLVPEGTNGIDAVLRNTCGQQYTFQLTSDEVRLVFTSS
jgi:hypothetical protein